MNRDADELRLPPHSLEAEQAVIGALMLSADAFERVGDKVDAADFYSSAHRDIFAAVTKLARTGRPSDPVTTAEALQSAGKLDAIGGLAYLGVLAQAVPSIANAGHYATIVRDRAKLRALAELSIKLSDLAYSRGGFTADEILDQAQREVAGIAEYGATEEARPIGVFLDDVVATIEARAAAGGGVTGLSTGLTDLDAILLGLHGGEVVIIAGRPSMGKTSLAMGMALCVTMQPEAKGKARGLVFSLEMKGKGLAQRAVAHVGHVNAHAMRSGNMIGDDWERVSNALGKLANVDLLIDGSPSLSIERLRARAKREHRRGALSIIVVDYLQLMDTPADADNRNNAVAEISRGLKKLAMELDVPIVVLSQLNRGLEQRSNKRPMIADLRDSGAIEQDADVILFIYRDEIYHPNNEDAKGKAEIIVAKQREGATGTVYVTFMGQFNRFADTVWKPQQTGPQSGGGWDS